MGLLDRAVERMKAEQAAEAEAAMEPLENPELPEPSAEPEAVGEGCPQAPVVAFDAEVLGARGYLVPGAAPDYALLEEYRRIKRDLLFHAAVQGVDETFAERPNMIMVTSSVDGEGKTFVATNLAFTIALEVDRTALLLDGDTIRRGATRLFGLEDRPGLMDVLAGEVEDLGDVIVQLEGVPNLRVLPAGQPRRNVNELLASQRMLELMDELANRYGDRTIVLDSPPMLMTSEAPLLTRLVGQVALVVHADRTPQAQVEQTLELVDEERFAGLILNRASRHVGTGSYDYYADD